MARVDGFLAGGLFFFFFFVSVSIVLHPLHGAAGASLKPLDTTANPWLRLGVEDDVSMLDDWAAGFGRRLSAIQRRQGSSTSLSESSPIESLTPSAAAKPRSNPAPSGLKSEASSIRLIRKRLPEAVNVTEDVVVANVSSVGNETAEPEPIPVTEVSLIQLEGSAAIQRNSTSPDETSSIVITPEETAGSVALNVTTTSTTLAPSSSVGSDRMSSTIPAKPLWRQRMELNQNHRRMSSTKPDSPSSTPSPPESTEATQSVQNRTTTLSVSTSTVPSLESSQTVTAGPPSSSIVTAVLLSSSTRSIQSSRIVSVQSSSSSVAWTPIVRLPVTGMRHIPGGTLKIQITSTRLPLPSVGVVPLTDSKALESLEEDNDVKQIQIADSSSRGTTRTTSSPPPPPPTTTTEMWTTTTKRTPPTPVLHSLEDILQRLVPARDDSFGLNPFLIGRPAVNQAVTPTSTDEQVNEIVSSRQLTPTKSPTVDTNGANLTTSSTKLAESTVNSNPSAHTTTSIYIVGVVAVIPLAGLILWIVRVQLNKRRERLNESETSSETGFRKRLPPVALTPSKHARLFYGANNDKEDLVSVSPGSGYSGGKSSPPLKQQSPWEFTRSRLRLQTLIGEGNFGQVWKAEAEDICGCQGTLLVAVKTVKDGAAAKEKQELLREMKIMQQVGPHPNVVALLGCCTEQEPFLLIMEYVMYGRLLTFLREHRTHQTYYNYSSDNEALTSRDLTTFAYCVAKGMEFIYSKGVVHRDLAARNVLVDHNKLCKVADFGLSRSVRDTAGEMYEQRVKGALPIRWMAPESLIQSVFTQKSDVWSFGILVWEIVTLGSTPYPGMEAREVMRRVKDGHRLERPSHCRSEFYRLMSRCWHSDPQRRPDFGELKSELGQLLDNADGYIDLDNFQDSIYLPLQSPSDESEKI